MNIITIVINIIVSIFIVIIIIIQTGMIEEYGKLMAEQASAGKSWSLKQVLKEIRKYHPFDLLLLLRFLV